MEIEKLKKIQKEALAHYNRMIAWAEKQPKKNSVWYSLMVLGIREGWDSTFCSYCKEFTVAFSCMSDCPLCTVIPDKMGISGCCGGLWSKMNKALSWKDWLKYAKKIRKFISLKGV